MKQAYISPTMTIVAIKHHTHLLNSVSVTVRGNAQFHNAGDGDGTYAQGGEARGRESNIWEEE